MGMDGASVGRAFVKLAGITQELVLPWECHSWPGMRLVLIKRVLWPSPRHPNDQS